MGKNFNSKVISTKDTVLVKIAKSDSLLVVDLIFENRSCDTVIVPAKFKNFYLEWESVIGIMISTLRNNKEFTLANYGDMQDLEYFTFSKSRFVKIPPRCKVVYKIDVSRFFNSISDGAEYSVSLNINYIYIMVNKKSLDGIPISISTKTNCVILKEGVR